MQASPVDRRATRGQRPRASTVFVAAFLAGAAAAVGLNRSLDVHLASCKPQVESEPIFVALRPLPQGAPVTVWDVALRDWPKAMLPAAAMRPHDSFEGMVLRQPIREGQPILTVQLAKAAPAVAEPQVAVVADVPAAVPAAVDAGVQSAAPVAPPMVAVVPVDAAVRSAEPEAAAPVVPPVPAATTSVPAAPTAVAETPAADLPQPGTVAQEPTLATPVAETAAPLVAEPIVVSTPALTEIDSVITDAMMSADRDVAPPRDPVMRYLVVPERIALEADRSFVPPPEPQPTAVTATVSDSQTASSPSPRPRTQQGRADGSERTSSSRDSHMQRPPRSASGQNPQAAKGGSSWSLRSMLPSLSIGMGAREPATSGGNASGQRTPDATRPASRGFGLFR